MNVCSIICLAASICFLLIGIVSNIFDHFGNCKDETDYMISGYFLALIFVILFGMFCIINKIDNNDIKERHSKNSSTSIEHITLLKDKKYKNANIYVNDKKISIDDIHYMEINNETKLIIKVNE